jgi:hypothetical protein
MIELTSVVISPEALSNHPISDTVTFKAGIAQYRLGKVVSAWRMNAISKWRYLLYGRGMI